MNNINSKTNTNRRNKVPDKKAITVILAMGRIGQDTQDKNHLEDFTRNIETEQKTSMPNKEREWTEI